MLHQKTKNPEEKFNLSPSVFSNTHQISRNLSTPLTGKKNSLRFSKKKKFTTYSNFQYTIFKLPQQNQKNWEKITPFPRLSSNTHKFLRPKKKLKFSKIKFSLSNCLNPTQNPENSEKSHTLPSSFPQDPQIFPYFSVEKQNSATFFQKIEHELEFSVPFCYVTRKLKKSTAKNSAYPLVFPQHLRIFL